jgi:hypothetical protein
MAAIVPRLPLTRTSFIREPGQPGLPAVRRLAPPRSVADVVSDVDDRAGCDGDRADRDAQGHEVMAGAREEPE